MAILGHAASAEDGSGFGMPGDQTGREVRMETLWQWFLSWVICQGPRQKCKARQHGPLRVREQLLP